MLMGPNIKLVNTENPMYIQKLNLNKFKAIFERALPKLAYTALAGQF